MKKSTKKILSLALVVVMTMSMLAMSASATPTVGGTPAQTHYFWWFGDPSIPATNYPSFQPTPMGDDAVVGYVYDERTGDLIISFDEMTYDGVQGWFSYISALGAGWTFDPSTHAGTLTFDNPPASPIMIQLSDVVVTLQTDVHIPVGDVWFELDY
jgi:hypothetical protein